MRKVKFLMVFVIITALISTMFIGCSSNNNTNDKGNKQIVKIRLNEVARSIFYAPMYAAISEGFMKEEGLEIDLVTGQGADKTMQAVLSNTADIGFCGSEQVNYIYNQGREDYTVIFAQLTKRDGSFLVSRNPEPDFKWENLKGKDVLGGRPGGVPEMALEYVLKAHGITMSFNGEKPAKDVNIITNVQFASMGQAFAGGIGQYAALFEPVGANLETDGKGYTVASIGKESGELPYTCFFTTKSYMEKHPDVLQGFTNALYKGIMWVDGHSDAEVAKSIKQFFPDTKENLLAKVVKRYRDQDSWQKDLIVKPDVLIRFQDLIYNYDPKLMPKKPPYNKIVTTKFAAEAAKKFGKK